MIYYWFKYALNLLTPEISCLIVLNFFFEPLLLVLDDIEGVSSTLDCIDNGLRWKQILSISLTILNLEQV